MMKKIFIGLFLVGCIELLAQAQPKDTTAKHYLIVWINYSVKKEGIRPYFEIDKGTSKSHPLNQNNFWNAEGIIRVSDEGKNFTINNEVDLLEFLSGKGWRINARSQVVLISKNYIQYLFEKDIP
ncbi:MAG: hypothetical protein ACK4K0_10265 [Flavobacteriales bacterium]